MCVWPSLHLHNVFLGEELGSMQRAAGKSAGDVGFAPRLALRHAGPPGPASAFFFSLALSSLAQLNSKLCQTWATSYSGLVTLGLLEHEIKEQ